MDDNNMKNALRYDFAKRCFLDIADYDYISARTLFVNSCKDQSLILMQQCIEKYLKATLLYNKIPHNEPITKSNHDLEYLLKSCQEGVDFFQVSTGVVRFIHELNGSVKSFLQIRLRALFSRVFIDTIMPQSFASLMHGSL